MAFTRITSTLESPLDLFFIPCSNVGISLGQKLVWGPATLASSCPKSLSNPEAGTGIDLWSSLLNLLENRAVGGAEVL